MNGASGFGRARQGVMLAALVGLIAGGIAVTARTQDHTRADHAGTVSFAPTAHSIAEHLVTMWVGSISVDRAVIQLTRAPTGSAMGDRDPWDFISGATLESSRETVDATESESRLADGTFALTLEFDTAQAIGQSVLVLRAGGTEHSYDVKQLNR